MVHTFWIYDMIYENRSSTGGTSRGYVRFRYVNLKGHVVKFTDGALRPR